MLKQHIGSLGAVRRFIRERKGSAAIELAMVTPMLILVLLGAYDFGRVFHMSVAVTAAAHTGAHWGSQSMTKVTDTAGMRNAAETHTPGMGITATASTECRCVETLVACGTACGTPLRTYAVVTATRTFTTIVNYPGIPNNIVLTRSARIRAQ
jgi:Flp pilus assembly protein TadG